MKHTIVICGYGPGISNAVAQRFGREGHPIAIIARNTEPLTQAESALQASGINARAFTADLTDADTVKATFKEVHAALGPIGIVHWNAFLGTKGDLLTASPSDLSNSFQVRVAGYIAAIQASLPDLESTNGAVLVTSGVFVVDDAQVNAFATERGAVATAAAAQHKATGLLTHSLAPYGVFMGEVVVNGFVKGTPGENGQGSGELVEPTDVAEAFWKLHQDRKANSVVVGNAVPAKRTSEQAEG